MIISINRLPSDGKFYKFNKLKVRHIMSKRSKRMNKIIGMFL